MRPTRTTLEIPDSPLAVQITDDSGRTLIDPARGLAYHSASGSLSETRHVYISNSGVQTRIEQGLATRVLEIGLGTGLGLLLTMDLACRFQAPLTYVALENNWVTASVLEQLKLDEPLVKPSLAQQLLAWRQRLPTPVPDGTHREVFDSNRTAVVHHGDANAWDPESDERFDAIYFDPFAPSDSPELWNVAMFSKLHTVLKQGGRLTTYCVRASVRQMIADAGFEVQTVKGPPKGKREVLVATKGSSAAGGDQRCGNRG